MRSRTLHSDDPADVEEGGEGQTWVSMLSGVSRKAEMSCRMRRLLKSHHGMRVAAPLPVMMAAMRLPQTSWRAERGVSAGGSGSAVGVRLPLGCWSGTSRGVEGWLSVSWIAWLDWLG